jgi:hypothetical protein
METKDDFASLLAALGRTTPQTVQSVPSQMQQPQMVWTPQYFQPQPLPTTTTVPQVIPANNTYFWVAVALLIVLLVIGVMYWMRSTKMKEEPESEEEETKQVFPVKEEVFQEEADETIAENLLNYARFGEYSEPSQNNYIDLSGFEIPTEERYNGNSGRKIVADESQEVLEYAKKRESLFENP